MSAPPRQPPAESPQAWPVATRMRPIDVLLLSACCGLAAGWFEVGTRVSCRVIEPSGRLYQMSRHFVWLAPLSNLCLFLGLGFILAIFARLWPRGGGWLGPRILCALAI